MSMLKFCLNDILHEKGMKQADLRRLTGLSLPEVSILCNREVICGNESIKTSTIIKICDCLGVKIEQLMQLIEPSFSHLVSAMGGYFTVVVGSRPCVILTERDDKIGKQINLSEGARRDAVGLWDMRALAKITCQFRIAPKIVETSCNLRNNSSVIPADVSELLQNHKKGVIISLGSPLVSGFSDVILLKMLKQGIDIPFQFIWDFIGDGERIYNKYIGKQKKQGIRWNNRFAIQIPSWKEIEDMHQGMNYDDGCVLVIWPIDPPILPIKERTWVSLIMGFMGSATEGGASFIFSSEMENLLSQYTANSYVQDTKDIAPPLFVLLRVKCEKIGNSGSREVIPIHSEIVNHLF